MSWLSSWLMESSGYDEIDRPFWIFRDQSCASLNAAERFWVDVQPFLLAQGYALRPRFHSNWTPSWRLDGAEPALSEDGHALSGKGLVMDAFRLQENARVALKRIRKTPRGRQEIEIMAYFAKPHRRSDTRNRCVPLLAIFDPGTAFDSYIVVMPLLQDLLSVAFCNLREVFDLLGQLFEGLSFMHDHNLEHRDICLGNVMMYAEPLYPEGHNPYRPRFQLDGPIPSPAPHIFRSDMDMQYYFIDFGLSNLFPSFEDRETLVMPRGQDRSAPELAKDEPTDGFALDVYCLGNLVKQSFLEHSALLSTLLGPLVTGMTVDTPSERFTAQESLHLFEQLRGSVSQKQLFGRLRPIKEGIISGLWYDAAYFLASLKRRLWPRHFKYLTSTYKQYAHLPYVTESSSDITAKSVKDHGREIPIPMHEENGSRY